jgi:cholesterol oxidase
MGKSYDVVVIGSGFGGAVSACRLAQSGRSVCVLERGKEWDGGEFPRSIGQVARAWWEPGRTYGFLEYKVFKRIDVIQGSGVGGGSLHYFNVTLRTPADIFEKPEWPKFITRKVMDPYYDVVEDMLDARKLVPPAGFKLPPRTEAFLTAARKAGKSPELVPIAVHTGQKGPNAHSGIAQEPCDYTGDCMLGCRIHAKNSLTLNYLPLARRRGAEIRALHQVSRIEPADGGGYKVHFDEINPEDPASSRPGHLLARSVIVSAGALGSTELLLRCKNVHKTLPALSPALGGHFSSNGDFLLAGTLNANREIDPGQGPSITAGADFSTANNRIFIEDLGYPNPFFWLLEGTIPSPTRLRELFIAVKTYILAALGCSNGRSRINVEADEVFKQGTTTRFLPYLGMGTDAADGRMYLKDGSIDIDWSPARSMRMFREMERALAELSRGIGGIYITSLLWRWPWRKLLTAHPLGGCLMGDSPATGVVDECGRVWNYPDLYVADGSIIPTALAVNPSNTIAALAERIAFRMIHGDELEAGDSRVPANTA